MGSKSDNKAAKEMSRMKRAAGVMPTYSSMQTERDARHLLDTIPRDSRTLTARILGDPLPERSALHMKQKELSA